MPFYFATRTANLGGRQATAGSVANAKQKKNAYLCGACGEFLDRAIATCMRGAQTGYSAGLELY